MVLKVYLKWIHKFFNSFFNHLGRNGKLIRRYFWTILQRIGFRVKFWFNYEKWVMARFHLITRSNWSVKSGWLLLWERRHIRWRPSHLRIWHIGRYLSKSRGFRNISWHLKSIWRRRIGRSRIRSWRNGSSDARNYTPWGELAII